MRLQDLDRRNNNDERNIENILGIFLHNINAKM